MSELQKFIDEQFWPLKEQFDKLKAEHDKLQSDYNTLVNGKNMKTINSAFTYASIVKNDKNSDSTEFKNCLVSVIANDLKQKERKENNIVISGVPKATVLDGKSDTNKDNNILKNIFEKLELNIGLIKKTSRLKNRDSNIGDDNNPILIELNDIDSKNKVMKNASKLKDFKLENRFIYLNNDLTFAERALEKVKREERDKLNASLTKKDDIGKYDMENGKAYYYAVRFGEIKKVFRK
jgi:hypothetical protein